MPSQQLSAWMRDIRRTLHQYPELGFEEFRTAQLIADKLAELSIPCRTGIARTGVLATLGPDEGTGVIALRADMDALPVEEKTGLPFASKRPGLMHACGHDGHVAMLLGAAALLKERDLPGRVVFLFQPAEEGDGGASSMIADGALDGVSAIFAGHIDRHFKVGEIGIEPGLICAYTDTFRITIKGKGGHAAKPHETVDCLVAASLLVMSIQTLVSRETNPSYPTVVTVGRLQGGRAANVIADTALLEGTIRSTHPEVRQKVINGLTRMVGAMEELYNAKTSIDLSEGYPPVINDPTATAIARQAATMVVGDHGVAGLPHPSLGGEDFSFYLDRVPGCLVRLGGQREGLPGEPAHSPRFDFDEGVLAVGAAYLAQAALIGLQRIDELQETQGRH